MPKPIFLTILFLLFVVWIIYLWLTTRHITKNKSFTADQYLWKFTQITGKSEYELFHIAAEEKGWADYQVEKHFKKYLEDQELPGYVVQFLEDGKKYLDGYRGQKFNFFDKKLLIFYSLFGLVLLGGSLFIALYFFPRYMQINFATSKLARPYVNRAISYAERRQYEKACLELKKACELGDCEPLNQKMGDCEPYIK